MNTCKEVAAVDPELFDKSTELFYRVEDNGSLTEVPSIPTGDDILRKAPERVPVEW